MKKKTKSRVRHVAKTPRAIAWLLGLSEGEAALMEYKADISRIAIKSIEESGLSVSELVKKSGVSRSKVSAIKNGATASVSIDLLFKIIAATGTKLEIHAA